MTTDVVLVGSGNITNRRHIPALASLGRKVRITGVVGVDPTRVANTAQAVRGLGKTKDRHLHTFVGDLVTSDLPGWVSGADLIVLGTPPRTHGLLTSRLAASAAGATLLVEKPLVVSISDREDVSAFVDRSPGIAVMHNFQFADGFQRALRMIADGSIGDLRSVQAYQWSTKARKLPVWYRDLPLGLFWDEAAHFFYLLEAVVGRLERVGANAFPSKEANDPTPSVLLASYTSEAGVPVETAMHFDAGISEWGLMICGDKGTIVYDMFRDIPIRLPYDGEHNGREVLRTSLVMTRQHWLGVVSNGLRLVRGNLHYGVDRVVRSAVAAASGEELDERISLRAGLRITDYMRGLADAVTTKSS
jgi:scyllo-inositol 2-dehydrogenase (NADP+)